jgi:hypothetical protein
MKPAERGIEFTYHFAERCAERRPSPDQDVVEAPSQAIGVGRSRHSYNFPQSAAHPVTLRGVANLPRHGEANTNDALVPARNRLHHEVAAGSASAACRGPKIAPTPEPFHGRGSGALLTH